MQDFLNFIRRQGVVGLAIGFILGGAVSSVVSSLVNDIIQPIIATVLGSPEGMRYLMIGPVRMGSFFVALIDFVIIAAVVYFIFKKLKLEKLDEQEEK